MVIMRNHRLLILLLITLVIALPFSSLKMKAFSEEQDVDGKIEEVEEGNSASEQSNSLNTTTVNDGSESENEPEETSNPEENNKPEESKPDEKTTEKITPNTESTEQSTIEEQKEDIKGKVEAESTSVEPMAIGTPGYYYTDLNAIVVSTELVGHSTNVHTKTHMLWADGNKILVAVKSTHQLQYMTLNGANFISFVEYVRLVPIYVDGVAYAPDAGLQGNTKDAHWTVFTFNMADLNLVDDSTYSFFVKGIGGGHDVGGTLGFIIPKTFVTAQKVWVGGTKRPAITLQLMAQVGDEEKKELRTGKVDGSETPAWTYKWTAVPEYDPYGRKYTFTADESTVLVNYEKSINGLTVTNTYSPQKIEVGVNKKWIGPAAESVTVQLFAEGKDTGKSLELNANNKWSSSFTGLNKFDDQTGEHINYTVKELQIHGYTSQLSGSVTKGFTFTNTNNAKIDIDVSKKWIGPKTESVTIMLRANDKDTGKAISLSEENNWSGVFKDLRKYDASTGTPINYTVQEVDKPANYDVTVIKEGNNFIVTNTAHHGSLTVEKVDAEGKPLAGATFELKDARGNVVDTLTTGADGTIKFEALRWADYLLKETKAPEGYNKLVRQIQITINGDNLHVTERVVNKPITWQLPDTGGIGTIGLYVVGFMLMVFALWAIFRKKQT